jgi:hypothetical protein
VNHGSYYLKAGVGVVKLETNIDGEKKVYELISFQIN